MSTKQRLFEIMGKIDESFEPKVDEDFNAKDALKKSLQFTSDDEDEEEFEKKYPDRKFNQIKDTDPDIDKPVDKHNDSVGGKQLKIVT
jgi:hypothetical protein